MSEEYTTEKQVRENFRRLEESPIIQSQKRAVCLIQRKRRGSGETWQACGSAFVANAKQSERLLLVTAHHVLSDASNEYTAIIDQPQNEGKVWEQAISIGQGISLPGIDIWYCTLPTSSEYSPSSIAIDLGPEELTPYLDDQNVYSNGASRYRYRWSEIYIAGYPVSRNKAHQHRGRAKLEAFRTRIDRTDDSFGYFNHDRTNFRDESGSDVQELPAPQGMSGSPVVLIGDVNDLARSIDDNLALKAIGVFIEWDRRTNEAKFALFPAGFLDKA